MSQWLALSSLAIALAIQQCRVDEIIRLEDAFFEPGKSELDSKARVALTATAQILRDMLQRFPQTQLVIEGHADETGPSEYNLTLGDARAIAALEFLAQQGVPGGRLTAVSLGKERPQCDEHTAECRQKNRRVHIGSK